MDEDIIDRLMRLRYIGPFPGGLEVLLVSIPQAIDEIRHLDPSMTSSRFKKILTKNDIFIFNSVEDWDKYKNPGKHRSRVRH